MSLQTPEGQIAPESKQIDPGVTVDNASCSAHQGGISNKIQGILGNESIEAPKRVALQIMGGTQGSMDVRDIDGETYVYSVTMHLQNTGRGGSPLIHFDNHAPNDWKWVNAIPQSAVTEQDSISASAVKIIATFKTPQKLGDLKQKMPKGLIFDVQKNDTLLTLTGVDGGEYIAKHRKQAEAHVIAAGLSRIRERENLIALNAILKTLKSAPAQFAFIFSTSKQKKFYLPILKDIAAKLTAIIDPKLKDGENSDEIRSLGVNVIAGYYSRVSSAALHAALDDSYTPSSPQEYLSMARSMAWATKYEYKKERMLDIALVIKLNIDSAIKKCESSTTPCPSPRGVIDGIMGDLRPIGVFYPITLDS